MEQTGSVEVLEGSASAQGNRARRLYTDAERDEFVRRFHELSLAAAGNLSFQVAARTLGIDDVKKLRDWVNAKSRMHRRRYTQEFIAAALARIQAGERLTPLAKELHLHPRLLRKWRKKMRSSTATAKPAPKTTHEAFARKPKRARRMFTPQQIEKAVNYFNASGKGFRPAAKHLGIHGSVLRRWVAAATGKRPELRVMRNVARPAVKKARGGGANKGNQHFPEKLKLAVVERLRKGEAPVLVAEKTGAPLNRVYAWGSKMRKDDKVAKKAARAGQPQRRDVVAGVDVTPVSLRDAIGILRHAQTEMNSMLAKGTIKQLDRAHLLTLLALKELVPVE